MNRFVKIMIAYVFSLFLWAEKVPKANAQEVTVSFQTFYDELSPYGQWVNEPRYGNVFVPNEGGDFRPYGSDGHWVMTDYGNTWVTDDPWGWACYHYGRWTYDSYYGWVWIPGYEWAPAWVSWRFGGGYCGWAPLGPGVDLGVSYNCPGSWWVFVAPQYMYQPDCFHHWRGPGYNGEYIRQTTFINNYYVDNHTRVRYNFGPRADAIQQVTHQPVQVYRVSQTSRPGAPRVGGNSVDIYRPAVNRATVSTARPANAIAAPRRLGAPQPATNVSASHQPAFRQQLQRQAPAGGGVPAPGRPGNVPGNINNQRPGNQPQNRSQPQQQPAQLQNRSQQQPQSRPQQQQNRPQQPSQPQNRPQQQPQNRPQQQPQTRPQPAPQPRQAPPPQQRQAPPPPRQMPQPQRQAPPPRQMPQPQPQRQAPPPPRQMPQPQPQRQAPPQQRQMPQPQPQRQAPPPPRQMPQPQPQRQAPPPQRQEAPHGERR